MCPQILVPACPCFSDFRSKLPLSNTLCLSCRKFQTDSPKLCNERHKTQRREQAGLPRGSCDFRLISVQPIIITKSYGIYVFLCQECWLYTQTYKILLITLSAPFDS